MGRAPCCDKTKVKKGPWSPEEDTKLKEYIEKYGNGGNWIALPQKAGLKRCGKSCRLRWLNYLRPNIKHGDFSEEEDRIICSLFAAIGSRWSIIAAHLPGRTDNDIKNYWNTKLKKKLMAAAAASSSSNPNSDLKSPISPSIIPSSHHESLNENPCCSTKSFMTNAFDQIPIIRDPLSSSIIDPPNLLNNFSQLDCFLMNPVQYDYNSYNPIKDSTSFIMSVGNSEPSCNSSDGSHGRENVKQEEIISLGFHHHHGQGELVDASNGYHEQKQKGYFGEFTGFDDQCAYDVKQMISTPTNYNTSCLSNVAENKSTLQEKGMSYYYY